MANINKAVPDADQYYPLNEPQLGELLPVVRRECSCTLRIL